MQKAKKQMTIEKLAVMIQKGFSETATKAELASLEQRMGGFEHRMDGFERRMDGFESRMGSFEHRMDNMDKKIDIIADSLHLVQQDVHDLKIAVGPMVRMVAVLELEVRNLNARVHRLEKKVGFAK